MRADEKNLSQSVFPLQYEPLQPQQRMPLREIPLWIFYHLRLLNWWLFLLVFLGFLGVSGLIWLPLHASGTAGLSEANELSRFVLEPGAGLLAGILTSSLIVGDPLLEIMMTTRTGIFLVVIWRFVLTFFLLLCCSAAYLFWSHGLGVNYAKQQSPLFLLLVWLAPVLLMSALSLLGALITRNAALGMVLAMLPLAISLFLYTKLLPIQATHPFLLSYTYSGGQDASDWWINRLTLLAIALMLAFCNWWWLQREERLLGHE